MYKEERMPNLAPPISAGSPYYIIGLLLAIAIIVVIAIGIAMMGSTGCDTKLHREKDGTLRLSPGGQVFPDMNSFQQYWHSPGGPNSRRCPLPVLTGAREVELIEQENNNEQMWATTPIDKVDDYEFSRVFGVERNGRMVIPEQNFNIILRDRNFDWSQKPFSSDERRTKQIYEGFVATGELKKMVLNEPGAQDIAVEAAQRYGEKPYDGWHKRDMADPDIDCKVSRETREIAGMVANAYKDDPDFEPVVTKVGPHQWEVNELIPKRRNVEYSDERQEAVVNTADDSVDVQFRYREDIVREDAIDPYFPKNWGLSERDNMDFYGPVPNMERMFGPTFDHKEWYKIDRSIIN